MLENDSVRAMSEGPCCCKENALYNYKQFNLKQILMLMFSIQSLSDRKTYDFF